MHKENVLTPCTPRWDLDQDLMGCDSAAQLEFMLDLNHADLLQFISSGVG